MKRSGEADLSFDEHKICGMSMREKRELRLCLWQAMLIHLKPALRLRPREGADTTRRRRAPR